LVSEGSCARKFNSMPFIYCNSNNVCKYAARNDKSYWLSTLAPIPQKPIDVTAVEDHISRCSVCEAPAKPLAVHSQSTEDAVCPLGWSSLWLGYSFVMHSAAGCSGSGQALSSSGSCLQDFRATPFIECNGAQGHCYYYNNQYSFWLTTIDEDKQFSKPELDIVRQRSMRSRASRCNVCMQVNP
jgi:integrin beta 8